MMSPGLSCCFTGSQTRPSNSPLQEGGVKAKEEKTLFIHSNFQPHHLQLIIYHTNTRSRTTFSDDIFLLVLFDIKVYLNN